MKGFREVPFLVTIRHLRRRRNPVRGAPRYRISLVKEAGSAYVTTKPVVNSRMVCEIGRRLFEDIDREAFYMLCLDIKSKIIGVNLVSLGTLSASLVHMREAFKAAVLLNAHSVIALHNHPSGEAVASPYDDALTRRLVKAGILLGIALKDHVIVGESACFSFADRGYLDAYEATAKRELGL